MKAPDTAKMNENGSTSSIVPLRFLTLVALLPQAAFLLMALTEGEASWTSPVAAFAYAAFIFSFLGGLWWGIALVSQPNQPLFFFVAILPMLVSFGLFMPWVWGWNWPGQQLIILGLAIMASFLVDWRLIGKATIIPGWLRLRIIASLGLGLMTVAIGIVTLV